MFLANKRINPLKIFTGRVIHIFIYSMLYQPWNCRKHNIFKLYIFKYLTSRHPIIKIVTRHRDKINCYKNTVIRNTLNFHWLCMFFFISLGGSGPVIWSYFAEFQPKSKRGSMLSFMAAFWTLGNLFVAGLAWVIIPAGEFPLNSYYRWISVA